MKRHVGVLLSTVSTAALTMGCGSAGVATAAPSEGARPPIERLNSIRTAYLAALGGEAAWTLPVGDRVAQFQNFPNFSNWRNQ
jgi:hypothetical protein